MRQNITFHAIHMKVSIHHQTLRTLPINMVIANAHIYSWNQCLSSLPMDVAIEIALCEKFRAMKVRNNTLYC